MSNIYHRFQDDLEQEYERLEALQKRYQNSQGSDAYAYLTDAMVSIEKAMIACEKRGEWLEAEKYQMQRSER